MARGYERAQAIGGEPRGTSAIAIAALCAAGLVFLSPRGFADQAGVGAVDPAIVGTWELVGSCSVLDLDLVNVYRANGTFLSTGTIIVFGVPRDAMFNGSWSVKGEQMCFSVEGSTVEDIIPEGSTFVYNLLTVDGNKLVYTDENDCLYTEHRLDPEALIDSDGDGLSDAYEREHFADATAGEPGVDSDGDRSSNLDEFLALTDPKSAGSMFQVHIEIGADGSATLQFRSHPGRRYSVIAGDELDSFNLTLLDRVAGNGEVMSFTDSTPGARRFYRVVVSLP